MDGLDAPATVHELGCQPIQEFRIDVPLTLRAEVFTGLDDPVADILLPDTVYGHARRQRGAPAHERPRETEPVRRAGGRPRGPRGGDIGVNRFAVARGAPADAGEG